MSTNQNNNQPEWNMANFQYQQNVDYTSPATSKYAINQFQNGRVINYNNNNIKDLELFEQYTKQGTLQNFQVEALYGIQESSKLSHVFFSRQNLNLIQDMIRYNVYIKSNKKYVIDRQSDVNLEIIMRSIYLQHSPNLPNKITEQLEYLNKLVSDWSVEQIIPEVEQYVGYLSEIEYMPMPIDLPRNLSSKGGRSLRAVTTTF
jgi:hypothetical protein